MKILTATVPFVAILNRFALCLYWSHTKVFEHNINTLARLNGLLIGAILTQRILSGTRQLWLNG